MVRTDSPILGGTHIAVLQPQMTMEQQMLLRTLREQGRPMSALELTNHWMPTWSLQEVNKFMQELVQVGCVQSDGKESKVYSISVGDRASGRKA